MGLKTTNYKIENIGITVPEAYAMIDNIMVDVNGMANATINIQQNRNEVKSKMPFDRKHVRCKINKDIALFEQVYKAAKEQYFQDWQDDIVTE